MFSPFLFLKQTVDSYQSRCLVGFYIYPHCSALLAVFHHSFQRRLPGVLFKLWQAQQQQKYFREVQDGAHFRAKENKSSILRQIDTEDLSVLPRKVILGHFLKDV